MKFSCVMAGSTVGSGVAMLITPGVAEPVSFLVEQLIEGFQYSVPSNRGANESVPR